MLHGYSEIIRGNLSKVQRLKIVALVTVEVHARDVIDKLAKAGCKDINAFDWLSQLRLYWEKVGEHVRVGYNRWITTGGLQQLDYNSWMTTAGLQQAPFSVLS